MRQECIVVCGATGSQGGATVTSLLASGKWKVSALTRSPECAVAADLGRRGVAVVHADLLDKESLVAAFRDVHGVFGVTQPWSPDYKKCDIISEVRQGRNIVDACIEAGVKHLVLTTVMNLGRERMGVRHFDSKIDIEDYARARDVPLTIIRPASFMDNVGMSFFPIRQGWIKGFVAEDAKVPYIACADIGALAACAFEHRDELIGKEINALSELVSGQDLADTLSKLRNGEPFRYKAPPAFVLWLFAREFYQLRRVFEKSGRSPHPKEYADAIEETRRLCPNWTSMERHLEQRGYATSALA